MKFSGLHEYIDLMKKWGDRIFIVGYKGYRTRPMSFGATRSSILKLSGILLKANVNKGDCVILFGGQSPEWVIAFFAILHRGAVVVPLDYNTPPGLFMDIYKRTSPALIISEKPPPGISAEFISFLEIEALGNNGKSSPAKVDPPVIETGDTAEIVFTSGTTSDPKGVRLTHKNIISNLETIKAGVEKKEKCGSYYLSSFLLFTSN